MNAVVQSFAIQGIDAYPVAVEADCMEGAADAKEYWVIVGLGDAAIKEARERVRASLKNSGFAVTQKKILVNLAPADVRKEGSHLDLPIALSILTATSRLPRQAKVNFAAVGELGLDGAVRPVPGILPMAIGARERGIDVLLVPKENALEGAYVEGVQVIGVETLLEAVRALRGETVLQPARPGAAPDESARGPVADFHDVKGQETAKRALEIAACGGHNAIMIGPPGTGKTMLAARLAGILPEMSFEEAIESTKIHSIAGMLDGRTGLVRTRPFRSPHHTISNVALVGGGTIPRPGEISLAHNGILFLDELPEFQRTVLEVLRQPLEDGIVNISRTASSLSFPAKFLLVAAMNPCPCGFATHPEKRCTCSPIQIQKYLGRISGPLLDRIDLHIDVPAVKIEELRKRSSGDSSSTIRARANTARAVQRRRFAAQPGIHCNAQMGAAELNRLCHLDKDAQALLDNAMRGLGLSARAYDRIRKVSRTLADMAGAEEIAPEHISEAVQYRTLDRNLWT